MKEGLEKLTFKRRKYGKELLIDASRIDELEDVGDTVKLSFYTLMILGESEGTYYIDGEKIILSPNTILFIKPGQINKVHQVKFKSGYFIFFEAEFLDEFFNDKNFIYKLSFFHALGKPSFLTLDHNAFQKIMTLSEEIWLETKDLKPDSRHFLRSVLYYLLILLNRFYSEQHQSYHSLLNNQHILQFKRLLSKNIRQDHSVQSYAKEIGISRTYLNQISLKYLGKTSNQVIRTALLLEAKKEIRFSQKDISQIAYDLDFTAPSHFIRFFKQMTDLTPQQYRKDLSNW